MTDETEIPKVVQLHTNRALAPDLDTMATRLEEFAALVRAGKWPNARQVIILLNDPDEVHTPWCYGHPINGGELVGVMEWVKHKMIRGD